MKYIKVMGIKTQATRWALFPNGLGRDELCKIVHVSVPRDLEFERNPIGNGTVSQALITKSEKINFREREQKDKEIYDAFGRAGELGGDGLL